MLLSIDIFAMRVRSGSGQVRLHFLVRIMFFGPVAASILEIVDRIFRNIACM